jgi:hypothetical protein
MADGTICAWVSSFATRYSWTCPRPQPAKAVSAKSNAHRVENGSLLLQDNNFTFCIYKRFTGSARGLSELSEITPLAAYLRLIA